MNKTHFMQQCYLQTGGWIPASPLTQRVELGDFCQIQGGRLRSLGNILKLRLVEEVQFSEALLLDENDWRIHSGMRQVFSATEQVNGERGRCEEWTKQVLEFEQAGSFAYYGLQPFCQLILNWSKLRNDVTLKLTQGSYSFRHLYVITEVALMENWGLAIASQPSAQLEMSAQIRTCDWHEIMSHGSCRAEQSKDMNSFARHNELPAFFFKAKKLVLSDSKREQFLRQIISRRDQLSVAELSNWLREDLINRAEANELNLNTCVDFFDWVDANLDDVAHLC